MYAKVYATLHKYCVYRITLIDHHQKRQNDLAYHHYVDKDREEDDGGTHMMKMEVAMSEAV